MHLTRTDPDANLYQYYRMDIVKDLFGDWRMVREWGRIGSSGQVRTDWFGSERDAKDARFSIRMNKAKGGYAKQTPNPVQVSGE